MAKITWDDLGVKYYEQGVDRAVLYPLASSGSYGEGVAWNGVTAVNENPSGADATDLWADNINYGTMRSNEKFGFTIEAYTYPDEFAACDGSLELADGVYVGQQTRSKFGFTYRTNIENDTGVSNYKIHLVYCATASPSGKTRNTINESPDAMTFSWECSTTAVAVTGYKPVAHIEIDTRKASKKFVEALEAKLYGADEVEPSLPKPDEVITLAEANKATGS